jgi:hypothetical protein
MAKKKTAAQRQKELIRAEARDRARGNATGGNASPARPGGRPSLAINAENPDLVPVDELLDLPAGSYDPAIDYQSGAANRGLGYQSQDYDMAFGGLADALAARPPDLEARNPDGSYKYGRAVRDYFRDQDRANQQYDWQQQDTARDYQILGNNQLQAINQAGVLGGGALAQALAKRQANEGRDQERISYGRTQTLADLLTNTNRGATDAYTGLQRAIGENAPYQATLVTQAAREAQPALASNPAYEVHNGVLYMRTPGGGVKPVSNPSTPSAPAGDPPGINQGRGTGGFEAPSGPVGRPDYTLGGGNPYRPAYGFPGRRRGRPSSSGGFVF